MTTTSAQLHIGLAGDGRLAQQLKILLDAYSLPFTHVARSKNSDDEIRSAIQKSTHVWLAISDSSIESFYQKYGTPQNAAKTWVHFSGAHNSQNIHSAHPLMTFSKTPISLQDWQHVHFVVSPSSGQSHWQTLKLNDLMPSLPNAWSFLPPEKKALYHSLCVLAGNFPVILWSEVLAQFQHLSIPTGAMHVYLDRVVSNFKNEGPAALTGPLVRNDVTTIKKNIQALEPASLKTIYEAFVKHKGITL